MSTEEFVRGIWARWNSGDREVRPDEIDPEIEVHSALTQTVFRGRKGVERWIREIDEQFSDWSLEIDAVDEPREGVAVATGAISMRGRQSGLEMRQPATWLVELREGRLYRLRNFVGPEAAAEAAAEER